MKKLCIFIILFFSALSSDAQNTALKFGAAGFAGGNFAGIATLGAEFFHKKKENKSWQISLNISGGAIATDADIIHRQWLTVDRIFLRKPMMKHDKYFLSFFTEAGKRKIEASQFKKEGYRLIDTRQFEINSGIAVGANFIIKKRWGFDMIAGPKLIIASGEKRYYNPVTRGYELNKFKSVKPGYRFMINLSYSLKN